MKAIEEEDSVIGDMFMWCVDRGWMKGATVLLDLNVWNVLRTGRYPQSWIS